MGIIMRLVTMCPGKETGEEVEKNTGKGSRERKEEEGEQLLEKQQKSPRSKEAETEAIHNSSRRSKRGFSVEQGCVELLAGWHGGGEICC